MPQKKISDEKCAANQKRLRTTAPTTYAFLSEKQKHVELFRFESSNENLISMLFLFLFCDFCYQSNSFFWHGLNGFSLESKFSEKSQTREMMRPFSLTLLEKLFGKPNIFRTNLWNRKNGANHLETEFCGLSLSVSLLRMNYWTKW